MEYTEKKFSIGEIVGISKKQIDEHLKLYAGYVKHTNLILSHIQELSKDVEKNSYEINEIRRRFGFEFNGMRNHEYYFEQLEGSPSPLTLNLSTEQAGSKLSLALSKDFGSVEEWQKQFKSICLTRGIGWAILYYDRKNNRLLNAWIDEQHLGQLNGLEFIYGIDMWEHSFLLDYTPSEKGKYVDAYLNASNMKIAEKRFEI